MRELNRHEIEQVSGAGIVADAGQALGTGIGAIVDAAGGNVSTAAADAGGKLGYGIGMVVEAGIETISTIGNIIGGIVGGILGGIFGRR